MPFWIYTVNICPWAIQMWWPSAIARVSDIWGWLWPNLWKHLNSGKRLIHFKGDFSENRGPLLHWWFHFNHSTIILKVCTSDFTYIFPRPYKLYWWFNFSFFKTKHTALVISLQLLSKPKHTALVISLQLFSKPKHTALVISLQLYNDYNVHSALVISLQLFQAQTFSLSGSFAFPEVNAYSMIKSNS